MTFDQWVDAVDAQIHRRLGPSVRTEELGWDSAMWVGSGGTVVAALQDDERTAKLSFDEGDSMAFPIAEAPTDAIAMTIAARLNAKSA